MARETIRACVTSPEELSRINPANLELIEEFMDAYEGTHSPKSVIVVRSNLNIFFVWILKHRKNIDFCEIKKKDILAYQNYLAKNGLSPARIRSLKSAISSLEMYIEDFLDDEEKWENYKRIANKVKAPPLVPVREKTVLTDEQVESYLDVLVEKKEYQKACALALAWASGRRKAELLEFKVSFFKEEYLKFGCLYESPRKIKTKGSGKLGKPLIVYVYKPKFKKYFDLYMEYRRSIGISDDVDDLFVKAKDDKYPEFKETTLNSFAEKFCREMGVNFYWHCMRHQLVTSLLKEGIPENVVKDLMGWESVEMVSVYSDVPASDNFAKFFSENGVQKVESKSLSEL